MSFDESSHRINILWTSLGIIALPRMPWQRGWFGREREVISINSYRSSFGNLDWLLAFHWGQRHRDFDGLKQTLLGNSNSLENNYKTKWPPRDRGWNTSSLVVPIARTHDYTAVDSLIGDNSFICEESHQPSCPSNRAPTGMHLWPEAGALSSILWPKCDPGQAKGNHKPVPLAIPGKSALTLRESLSGYLWRNRTPFFTFGELHGKVPNSVPSFHWVLLDQLQCAPTALTLTPTFGLI